MSINMNACRPSPKVAGNVITCKVRLVWPRLFTPSAPAGSPDGTALKYQVSLLIPKGSDISLLEKAIKDAAIKKMGNPLPGKLKLPIAPTKETDQLVEYADAYPLLLRTSSQDKPNVVDPALRAVEDDEMVYGGRWAIVSLNPYGWTHPTGGKGVSLGLVNVQLLDHDDPIATRRVAASSEFEAIEGADGGEVTSTDSLFAPDAKASTTDSLFGGLST